jgi:feruloyl esterase
MESWVEQGQAPNALMANAAFRQFSPGAPKPDYLKSPNATMPLCKFPAMARYSGQGDPKDGVNWSCPAQDRGLLELGESGRQAGVVR